MLENQRAHHLVGFGCLSPSPLPERVPGAWAAALDVALPLGFIRSGASYMLGYRLEALTGGKSRTADYRGDFEICTEVAYTVALVITDLTISPNVLSCSHGTSFTEASAASTTA